VSRRRAIVIGIIAVAWIVLQVTAPPRTNPRVDPAVALNAGTTPLAVVNIFRRSCYDCHSSETRWPWYSAIAPGSWLVITDVNDGRGQMNFSRWGSYNPYDRADLLDKICDNVTHRKMPLWQYRLIHTDAPLSDDEISAVCAWTKTEAAKLTGAG
jgi:hypothetical protein